MRCFLKADSNFADGLGAGYEEKRGGKSDSRHLSNWANDDG